MIVRVLSVRGMDVETNIQTPLIFMPIKPLCKLDVWQQNSSLDMSLNTSETKDSTSTLPGIFQFPEISLPPRNHRVTTFAKLVPYFDKRPSELRDAFKTTYDLTDNLEVSNSLLEFLDKWVINCKNPLYYYIAKEFPVEFVTKLLTIHNIEANLMGCVFLASLYPRFRRNYLKKFDTQISEQTIAHHFIDMVRSRDTFLGLNPFSLAHGNYLE